MLHFVIMAGGSGTRFWPASRAARPKQLLPLAGEQSMLQMTHDRLGPLASPENVWVLTSAALVDAVREQLPAIPRERIVGEPCKRDTAPCIGLAALLISQVDPDASMAVLAADHIIEPADAFQKAISVAAGYLELAAGKIITFGIKPSHPAATFGYIERGEPIALRDKEADFAAYRVARFREKPPAEVAREYVASGRFYWNSGMFCWKASTILASLSEHQPEMLSRLQLIACEYGKADFEETFSREFSAISGISIDYAVMEHAADAVVIEAPFTWDDVGTWQAAARLSGTDAEGNSIQGRHIGVDTRDTIVRTTNDHLVATVGARDLIIVHTPDATLVANRRDEESIRRLTKLLEERGWTGYL